MRNITKKCWQAILHLKKMMLAVLPFIPMTWTYFSWSWGTWSHVGTTATETDIQTRWSHLYSSWWFNHWVQCRFQVLRHDQAEESTLPSGNFCQSKSFWLSFKFSAVTTEDDLTISKGKYLTNTVAEGVNAIYTEIQETLWKNFK